MEHSGRDLPHILRRNRKVTGFSQTQLARLLRMKKSKQVYRWEKGQAEPSIKYALLLCLFYKIPVADFFARYIEELRTEYAQEIDEFLKQQPVENSQKLAKIYKRNDNDLFI